MTTQETTLSQALAAVEYVVDRQGATKGVFLTLEAWQAVLGALEDLEDLAVAKTYLRQRAAVQSLKEMALLRWEDVAGEWDDEPTSEP